MSILAHLTPRPLKEWFRRFLAGGVQAVAAEEAAGIQGDVLVAQDQLFEKTMELVRKTRPHRESDDPLERELAAAHAASLKEITTMGRSMFGQATAAERQEQLARPLGSASPASRPSLPPGSSPGPNGSNGHGPESPEALDALLRTFDSPRDSAAGGPAADPATAPAPNPEQPVRRKRGRPPKNRPQA